MRDSDRSVKKWPQTISIPWDSNGRPSRMLLWCLLNAFGNYKSALKSVIFEWCFISAPIYHLITNAGDFPRFFDSGRDNHPWRLQSALLITITLTSHEKQFSFSFFLISFVNIFIIMIFFIGKKAPWQKQISFICVWRVSSTHSTTV